MTKVKLVLALTCAAVMFGILAAQEHPKREPMTFA